MVGGVGERERERLGWGAVTRLMLQKCMGFGCTARVGMNVELGRGGECEWWKYQDFRIGRVFLFEYRRVWNYPRKRDTEEAVYVLLNSGKGSTKLVLGCSKLSFPWRVWPTIRQGCTCANVGDPHSSVDEGGRG